MRSGTSWAVGWKWSNDKVIESYFDISCSMINYQTVIKKILKIERRKRNFLQNLESREEKKRSLWRWNSYKKQHTILYYFILSSGPLLPQLLPACCSHSAVFIPVKKRYVVVLFCRIGTIQNHSYELPLPSPLDIFKDDPSMKNATKGERICHHQIDGLMLWL